MSINYKTYYWSFAARNRSLLNRNVFCYIEASPKGVFDPELAAKFKATFLEKGGSEEPMILYKQFTGREPDNKAFLRGRGLTD